MPLRSWQEELLIKAAGSVELWLMADLPVHRVLFLIPVVIS